MNIQQYLEAVAAQRDQLDQEHCRCFVDIRCRENRQWLRTLYPDYPISYRDYQAVMLPLESFRQDPELLAQLKLSDSILVVEAGGQLVVQTVPTN